MAASPVSASRAGALGCASTGDAGTAAPRAAGAGCATTTLYTRGTCTAIMYRPTSCLILLLWFCSSAAAHRASGQHAVHNGVDADRRLPSTLFSRPSILASPIRESVFKLCVSRMFMAPRGGTAAPPHG